MASSGKGARNRAGISLGAFIRTLADAEVWFYIKDWKEITGQLPRLLVGGVKSLVGKIPVGNTGGANVPPLKSMPIPEDIQKVLNF